MARIPSGVCVPHIDRALALVRTTRAISDGRLLDAASGIERMREAAVLAGGLGTVWVCCQLLLMEARGEHESLVQLVKQLDVSLLER